MNADETLKRGIDAAERIQKAVNTVLRLLNELDENQDAEVARSSRTEIENVVQDVSYDLDVFREVLLDQDETTRSVTAAYRESWHALPKIYRQAVQDTLTRAYGHMDEQALDALSLTINALSEPNEHKRAELCEQLRDFFANR
jgi:ATPase subunit of ABC transporter with duplicated ATPase domains